MPAQLRYATLKANVMYRCHFTRNGPIAGGEDLKPTTLEGAIEEARALLIERSESESFDGYEIWQGNAFLYASRCR
jgi:hypothetical protein